MTKDEQQEVNAAMTRLRRASERVAKIKRSNAVREGTATEDERAAHAALVALQKRFGLAEGDGNAGAP